MKQPGTKSGRAGAPGGPSQTSLRKSDMMGLITLSGRDVLNRVLEAAHPLELVQGMSRVDFYWLVKKVGEDDALPLLQLASREQWEYLLDMEVWEKDRLSSRHLSPWVERLYQASPARLVAWFFGEGQFVCYFYFTRNIRVEVRKGEEVLDLPEDFFTLDNLYYIQILDKEQETTVTALLRQMAAQDYDHYQAVLLSIAGVIPSDLEEEMYRLRNLRLAEDGFLPFEEACSLYSYFKTDVQNEGFQAPLADLPLRVEGETPVPTLPFLHVEGDVLLARAVAAISDPMFLDRLRLDFAGLCNQVLSADMVRVDDLAVLVRVCRKAAGYLNLGLEKLTGSGLRSVEELLRRHSLLSIFRVGFSVTLELRWEVERRVKDAWFTRTGLGAGFWGEDWGGKLSGILQKRPLFHGGDEEEEIRPFERLSEVEDCRAVLGRIFALDALLGNLADRVPLDPRLVQDPQVTYHGLLFTFWARSRLNLAPGFEPITPDRLCALFDLLRKGEAGPPFSMSGHGEVFLADFAQYADRMDQKAREVLGESLSALWEEFREEYARVAASDLDMRFSRFILVQPFIETA